MNTQKMGPRNLFNEMVLIAWELGDKDALRRLAVQQRRAAIRR